MGVNETVRKEKIAKYLEQFQEAVSQGRIDDCIAVARSGIAEYPNSYMLLNKLMYALFLAGDSDGNIPEWQENMKKYDSEITMIGERIMKYCPDQDIRLEAAARLAFNHCEMGRRAIGRAIFETLPSQKYCKETQIWWALDEEEKLPFIRTRIQEGYAAMYHGIYLLLGERLLPDEELLKVCRKLFALQELVFDGKEPVEWGTVRNHCTMAALLARLKQYDSILLSAHPGTVRGRPGYRCRPQNHKETSNRACPRRCIDRMLPRHRSWSYIHRGGHGRPGLVLIL